MKRPAEAPEVAAKRHCTDMPCKEMEAASLDEAFDMLVEKFASRPAVEDDVKTCWTYRELQEASFRIAAGMLANIGQGADPPIVALLLPRTCAWLAACVATIRVGTLLALSCDLCSEDEVLRNQEAIAEHRPRLLVLGKGVSAPSAGVPLAYVEDLLMTKAPFEQRRFRHLDDTLYLVYTGGTTAASKCVVQTHRMALHELRAYEDFGVMNCEDRILHHTSAFWGATCLGLFDLPWSCGACLVLVSQHGVSEVARAINERQITVAGLVPSLLDALDEKKCRSLRTVFTWGEPLRPSTIDAWRSRVQLLDLLIASEYWLVLCADHRRSGGFRPVREARLTLLQAEDTAYREVPREVPPGEVGELYIAGPMVSAIGYVKTSLNEGAFVELPVGAEGSPVRHYRTRDLARFRADGTLEYCGRADGFAKVGGKWLDLAAVERSLQSAGCREASLLWDEKAKVRHACVVPESSQPLAALATKLQALLPPQTRLHVLKQLPKNAATGKIARGVLLQELRQQDPAMSSSAKSRRPVSRSLRLGLHLASGLGRHGGLVPLTLSLAPGLLELLWQGHGNLTSLEKKTDGNGMANGQNGHAKEETHSSEKSVKGSGTVPLGVAERVSSWLSWYRSIAECLSLKELEVFPYICLLLVDGAETGLEDFVRVLQNPMGLLGTALFLCRRAPRWAKVLWHLVGHRHSVKRGGHGWTWVFWLGFPGFADSWSSHCWHAWPGGLCRTGAWQALSGIIKELPNGTTKEARELMRCTNCWDWVPESSCTIWRRKNYCSDCCEGWEVYKKQRCEELGVETISPDPTPDGTPWATPSATPQGTPMGTPPATPRVETQVLPSTDVKEKESTRKKGSVVTLDFADYEVSLASRQAGTSTSTAPRQVNGTLSKVAQILERSTGVSADGLSGLESLKVIILVSALRRELGVNLAAGDVLQCSSISDLEALVEAAAAAPRPTENVPREGQNSIGQYPIYAIPRFWKAPVGWLISLHEIPDETSMRIACRALVRRHVGLRAVPYRTAGDEVTASLCLNAVQSLLVLRALIGVAEAGSRPLLDSAAAAGLLDAWPRVASSPASGGWPMCEAGGAEELAHFEWLRFDTEAEMRHAAWLKARSRGFKTPASISVLSLPGSASNTGKDSAYLHIAVNHAVTDAACIVPLVADLLELHRAAKTLTSSDDLEAAATAALERCQLPEAPDGLAIAQARLRSAVLGTKVEGWEEQLDLAQNSCPPRKRGYDHYVKLAPSAGRMLEAASTGTGIPTDHLLVAALAASLGSAAKLDEVKLTLIVPMRDGPGHGQAVANLASTRHLSVWIRSRSLFDIALELSSRFRRRDWHMCHLLDDDGDRLFINLRGIPAFDGATPVIEPQDTTRRPTRFVRNIVEMFADQETLHSWTLWMGLREDVDANAFSRALRKALWGLATKPLDLLE